MREILFRGKDKLGKWRYGDLLQYASGEFAILTPFTKIGYEATQILNRTEITPETVGQYTGRCDKNDIKIFEHDLFQVAGNRIYEVVYCDFDDSYDGDGIYCCFALFDKERNITISFDYYAMKNGKVIGNIHDNTELLEVKE